VLQIIGTKQCKETRKAIRFCKERSIAYQYVDLKQRSLSPGEWDRILSKVEPRALIDEQSSYYSKEGYAWREFDAQEELIGHPQLLKTPVLRDKSHVAVGYDIDFLDQYKERQ
jgi:arsenate reductase-like glutaredoxin family protein